MRLDSFFFGALCVMSGGRLPAARFMVFLLDSKGAKVEIPSRKKSGKTNKNILMKNGAKAAPVKKCVGLERSVMRKVPEHEPFLPTIGVVRAENGPSKACGIGGPSYLKGGARSRQ